MLRKQGLILAVITNMNTTGPEILDKLELTGHVDFAITSLEAKAENRIRAYLRWPLIKLNVNPWKIFTSEIKCCQI